LLHTLPQQNDPDICGEQSEEGTDAPDIGRDSNGSKKKGIIVK
jgi:hypothetical protein